MSEHGRNRRLGRRRSGSFVDFLLERAAWLCVGIAAGVAGCTSYPYLAAPTAPYDDPPILQNGTVESWAPRFAAVNHFPHYIANFPSWFEEAARRYDSAVLVFSHGNSLGGVWVCDHNEKGLVSVMAMVLEVRQTYPDHRIVLVICNPGHHNLDLPNVSYATEDVWIWPDRALHPRFDMSPETVGNIFEFKETP